MPLWGIAILTEVTHGNFYIYIGTRGRTQSPRDRQGVTVTHTLGSAERSYVVARSWRTQVTRLARLSREAHVPMNCFAKLATQTCYSHLLHLCQNRQGTVLGRIRSHFIFTTVLHFSCTVPYAVRYGTIIINRARAVTSGGPRNRSARKPRVLNVFYLASLASKGGRHRTPVRIRPAKTLQHALDCVPRVRR